MTTSQSPGGVLIAALQLARERITASTLAAKQAKRDQLKDLISRVQLHEETGSGGPSADELRDAFGDPDDKTIRDALAAWGNPGEVPSPE